MRTDRVTGCALFLAACLYLFEARSFVTGFIADPIGPRAFPYVLGTILAGLAVWLAFRPEAGPSWPSRALWRPIAVVGALASYAALLVPLGFIISTSGLLVIVSTLFGGRISKSVLFALAFSIITYALFRQLLALGLPPGTIFFGGR